MQVVQGLILIDDLADLIQAGGVFALLAGGAGIRAAQGMARLGEPARDELCLLVVLNTASLQLLHATVASVRAAAGAAAPFDILPAVWLSSALSVSCGLGAAAFFRRLWP